MQNATLEPSLWFATEKEAPDTTFLQETRLRLFLSWFRFRDERASKRHGLNPLPF